MYAYKCFKACMKAVLVWKDHWWQYFSCWCTCSCWYARLILKMVLIQLYCFLHSLYVNVKSCKYKAYQYTKTLFIYFLYFSFENRIIFFVLVSGLTKQLLVCKEKFCVLTARLTVTEFLKARIYFLYISLVKRLSLDLFLFHNFE